MTAQQTQESKSPKIDTLMDLLQIFTLKELENICRHAKTLQSGWGRLTISFNGNHKHRVEITKSFDLDE